MLANKLEGETEVATPLGRIDLLTRTCLIEIKKAVNWKAGVGQLLAYSIYYPKHKLVLYLFDCKDKNDINNIELVCAKSKINVKYL